MQIRYVPFLRWKAGEKTALLRLSTQAKIDSVPYILLGADNFKDKKATKRTPALTAAHAFATELVRCWGPSPIYLDATPLAITSGLITPLESAADQVAVAGGKIIPALSLKSTNAYQNAVIAVARKYSTGVALRVSLSEMTNAKTWIRSWPFALSETDLIIDLDNSVEAVAALGSAVVNAFLTLEQGGDWRSVTISGTSIPDNFTGLAAGLYERERIEYSLWRALSSSKLPYVLHYGDYATVSTATPAPGIAWGYPITVKYTLPQSFLICRGVRTRGFGAQDMSVQLVKHAQSIVGWPSRSPLSHCWADKQIDAIAAGLAGPQGLGHWVSLGVNRHMELVRALLP